MSTESEKHLCRCCLSSDKAVKHLSLYSTYYREICNISVISDSIPPWICTECIFLLKKCVKFKYKVVKAHEILNDYLIRCAPFTIDGEDPELFSYKSSHLSETKVLVVDNQKSVNGFHPVIEHIKIINHSPLNTSFQSPVTLKVEQIKEESNDNCSDLDDDTPLLNYQKCTTPIELECKDKVKLEKVRKKKIIKRSTKSADDKIFKPVDLKSRKKVKTEPIIKEPKRKGRKSIKIDPEKIKCITLSLEEQLEMRKKLCEQGEYLRYPYHCEMCYLGFNHEVKWENHMKKHSPSRGKYHCEICKMYLPTLYSFKVHESSHTSRYECLKCGRILVNRLNMVRHYSSEHEGLINQYCCKFCGKRSTNYSTHTSHIRDYHKNNVRPKCEVCGKILLTKASLIDHMLIHKGIKNFTCDICGDKFRTTSQVKFHKIKHVTTREYYCVECDSRFKSERNLKLHLLKSVKHQEKLALLRYPCSKCPARFMSSRVLSDHISFQHEGLRLYQCDHCGREFASANTLSKHIRKKHPGVAAVNKHSCHICGEVFERKTNLVDHIKNHTDGKTIHCEDCGKTFTHSSTMQAHVISSHLKYKRHSKNDSNEKEDEEKTSE